MSEGSSHFVDASGPDVSPSGQSMQAVNTSWKAVFELYASILQAFVKFVWTIILVVVVLVVFVIIVIVLVVNVLVFIIIVVVLNKLLFGRHGLESSVQGLHRR